MARSRRPRAGHVQGRRVRGRASVADSIAVPTKRSAFPVQCVPHGTGGLLKCGDVCGTVPAGSLRARVAEGRGVGQGPCAPGRLARDTEGPVFSSGSSAAASGRLSAAAWCSRIPDSSLTATSRARAGHPAMIRLTVPGLRWRCWRPGWRRSLWSARPRAAIRSRAGIAAGGQRRHITGVRGSSAWLVLYGRTGCLIPSGSAHRDRCCGPWSAAWLRRPGGWAVISGHLAMWH